MFDAITQVVFTNAFLDVAWVLLPQPCLDALAYN